MPPTTTLDGRTITKVTRVVWQHDDDKILRGATVVGRAIVDVDGGGRFHGLLLVPSTPLGTTARLVTVVWERSTGRFAAVPTEREP